MSRFHLFTPSTATASSEDVALAWAVGRLDASEARRLWQSGASFSAAMTWAPSGLVLSTTRTQGNAWTLLLDQARAMWDGDASSPRLAAAVAMAEVLGEAGVPAPADAAHHWVDAFVRLHPKGCSPRKSCASVLQALLSRGAAVDAPNAQGHTALSHALAFTPDDTASLLIEAGASVLPVGEAGTWPLQALLHSQRLSAWDGARVREALTWLLPAMERVAHEQPSWRTEMGVVIALAKQEMAVRVREGDWNVLLAALQSGGDFMDMDAVVKRGDGEWQDAQGLLADSATRLAIGLPRPGRLRL